MFATARHSVSVLLCSALIAGAHPTTEAQAGKGAIAAGIAGFAVGVAAGHALAKKKTRRPAATAKSRPRSSGGATSTSSRQQARRSADVIAVQKALSHYGFYKGAIDGIAGRGTRGAISAMQQQMGWPVTGELTDEQKAALLTQYANAQNGQPTPANTSKVDQLFAMINGGTPAATGGGTPGAFTPIPATTTGPVMAGGIVEPAVQQPAAVPPAVTAQLGSYRAHCPDDGGAAKAASGLVLAAASGAALVPGQFCAARSAALVRSADIFAQLSGVDLGQVQAECARISDMMQPHRASLAAEAPADAALKVAKEFETLAADQREGAVSNFMVCLGVGYANDRSDVVISASLGLVGLGETGYGELIGASLALGAGVPADRAKGAAWLDYTAEAIEAGGAPVAPEAGVERATILRLVSAELAQDGGTIILASADAAPQPAELIADATAAEPAPEPSGEPADGSGATAAAPGADTAAPPVVVASAETGDTQTAAGAAADDPAAAATAPTIEVANVEQNAGPAATPAAQRRQDATAFFEREMAAQAGQLDGLVAALGADKAGVAVSCRVELDALSAPSGAASAASAGMMLRICRSWAYATGERPAMYWFDRALSDSGDADAEARLLKHLLLGHDRQAAAAQ